ncbi:uncharacterized protein J3R85_019305 [Psidium guajava]|nr:uncharacterized protein J3R85_019305 [Psidium guajava]
MTTLPISGPAEEQKGMWVYWNTREGETRWLWRSERCWEFDWIILELIWLSDRCRAAPLVLGRAPPFASLSNYVAAELASSLAVSTKASCPATR